MRNLNKNVKFESIWYATEERAKSPRVKVVYDEVCELTVTGNNYVFKNNKFEIVISNVKNIRLGRRALNWQTFLIVNLAVLVTMLNSYSFQRIFISMLIANLLAVLSWYTQPWIIVEGSIDDKTTTIYMLDGRYLGWSGKFGGTKKLYRSLKAVLIDNKI